jgi:hypothetical protein
VSPVIAFGVLYGEAREGFFPDSLLAHLGACARAMGCDARMVRVYYDGRDPERDAEVGRRFRRWLEERGVRVLVLDRVIHPEVVRGWAAGAGGRRCVHVSRGESFDPVEGVDYVIGAAPGLLRRGATRRAPSLSRLARAFEAWLRAWQSGEDPGAVAGVARVDGAALRTGAPLPEDDGVRAPFDALVAQEVISLDAPPRTSRRTLFGNVGCPYAADPLERPFFAGVTLPADGSIARLGCAFCDLGGDYERRADAEVIAEVADQAAFWSERDPSVEEFVLSDQHAVRYLAPLLRAAAARGVRPMRWLFAARVDTFVRELQRVRAAVAAAEEAGQSVELYLSGYEAFSDDVLDRFNKGVTVAEQLAAVEAMRALAREHPRRFAYARARGHSLILWDPWTRPEELAESVSVMRSAGLGEMFHAVGRNRLRLYRDLPLFHAAARDGALRDRWEDGDEGAGERKGYNPEHPWRFLDGRSRVAYELALWLRETLGEATELSQLAAVAAYARSLPAGDLDGAVARAQQGVVALREALASLEGARAAGAPRRGASVPAAVLRFAGACNNACGGCSNRDSWLPDDQASLEDRLEAARSRGPRVVAFAGREPTLHPGFLGLVRRARGADGRAVAVVSNGRRFVYEAFARASVAAGLRSASVKVFGAGASIGDAVASAQGAHAQSLAGVAALRAAGVAALELRAMVYGVALPGLAGLADMARSAGVSQLRVEAALDAVGLARSAEAAEAIGALSRRCAELDVALEASPLGVGTAAFDRVPATAPHSAASTTAVPSGGTGPSAPPADRRTRRPAPLRRG